MKNSLLLLFFSVLWVSALTGSEYHPSLESLIAKRNQAQIKVDRTLIKELTKLRGAFTKRGDLKSANEADALIKQTQRKIALAMITNSGLDGIWNVHYTQKNGGKWHGKREFKGKFLIDEHGHKRPLKIENDFLIIDWSNGGFEKLSLPSLDATMLIGMNNSQETVVYKKELPK